jgi:hypothetical protein
MTSNNKLIENIKSKQISKTKFGNCLYSNLWYIDDKNKVCITFTPRGGCSISFQQYLDLVGLLNDGLQYNSFIHHYRCDLFDININHVEINDLIDKNYIFIKFIMNPYIRAVSIYRAQSSHNLSFREYLKQLNSNNINNFNDNDKFHLEQQYIDGEEKIITKYIKINENEIYPIILNDGTEYIIDVNKFTSIHHGIKNKDNNIFCGDLTKDIIYDNLPSSYKYFYDDEIKNLVYNYYKDDIEKYGFKFEDM